MDAGRSEGVGAALAALRPAFWLAMGMACCVTLPRVGVTAELSSALGADAPLVAPASPAPGQEEEVLEEVIVKGERLWQLRAAIVKAEDRFYARWNELNKDRDFDMKCYMEAPLGTRLKSRICRVAFYEDAQAEYAQAMMRGQFAPSPTQVALDRQVEYRKVAMELLNDPQLRKLVREREAAQKKYTEERKKRFKDRWIIFE